jgi:hypothetical protein
MMGPQMNERRLLILFIAGLALAVGVLAILSFRTPPGPVPPIVRTPSSATLPTTAPSLVGTAEPVAPSDGTPGLPSASDEPISLSGDGHRNSPPFQLAGGDYAISSTVTPSDSDPGLCVFGSFLRSTDGSYGEIAGDANVNSAAAQSSMTYLYGVPAGRYYVEVIANCGWKIVITQQ